MARVYAIASAKGGVGKTTTTANLAATLAAADYDVAVVDGDVGMANLGAALGVEPMGATLHDVLGGDADVVDAVYEGPHGLDVVPGDTDLAAFGDADPRGLGRVVGWFGDRDFVLLDTSAGLSYETALPLGLADAAVLVTTPERDALGDTEKTRQLVDRVGGETAGAVLNRVAGGADADLDPLAAPLLGTIQDDPAIAAGVRAGEPITVRDPGGSAAAAYRDIASEVADGPVRPPVTASDGESGAETPNAIGTDSAGPAPEPVDGPGSPPEETGVDDSPGGGPTATGEDSLDGGPTATGEDSLDGGPTATGEDSPDGDPTAAGKDSPDGDPTAAGDAAMTEPDDPPSDPDDLVVEPEVEPLTDEDDEDDDGGFLSRLFGG